jgi:hypothetical protein
MIKRVISAMTVNELADHFSTAQPRQFICYFRGELGRVLEEERRNKIKPISDVARLARRYYEEGAAELVQRKRGFCDFEYLIVKKHQKSLRERMAAS